MCLKKMTFQYCFDGSIKKVNNLSVSSPRTWGCFHSSSPLNTMYKVFPTHVGVFPSIRRTSLFLKSLPHARGGVSIDRNVPLSCGPVFPTHVGVFPERPGFCRQDDSLPHARGGVSEQEEVLHGGKRVFPTHVGVFLRRSAALAHPHGLPHARGGVSRHGYSGPAGTLSSPRTWGCFRNG